MSAFFIIFVLSLVAYSVRATPNQDVVQACKDIEAVAPVVYSGLAYTAELRNYWSYACTEAQPYCIVQPLSAKHVSEAVKVLNKYPQAQFAVKSGGHDPNVGHSSIKDGVLIALGQMAGATYDRSRQVALVKPGGKWGKVLSDLQPDGVVVVGGRLSVVGVAGLVLGGGLSFLSAQHGLASDNIVDLEVVFPNGTIGNVNADNHPTLLRAMKGSNTQFGIVTQMTLQAYEMGLIWGGQKVYLSSHEDKLIEAFHDFTENPVDPKAAIILTLEKVGSTVVPVVFYFYQGPTPPQGVFKQFEDIHAILDRTKTRTYQDFVHSNSVGGAAISPSQRSEFRTSTFPILPGDNGILQKNIVKAWKEGADRYRSDASSLFTVSSLALQSWPNYINEQSEKKGGNAMGLRASDGPRFITEFTTLWSSASDDHLIHEWSRESVDAAQRAARIRIRKSKMVDAYCPYFMNDAGKGQRVTESYRDYGSFKQLQREIDPERLFERAGGFKY